MSESTYHLTQGEDSAFQSLQVTYSTLSPMMQSEVETLQQTLHSRKLGGGTSLSIGPYSNYWQLIADHDSSRPGALNRPMTITSATSVTLKGAFDHGARGVCN